MGYITSSSTTRPTTVTASSIRADLSDSSTSLSSVASFSSSTTYSSGTVVKDSVDSSSGVYLYGIAYTGSRSSDTQFVCTDIETNLHIRKDGLVKIGGVYHKIAAVDYTTGTITFDSAVGTGYTQAFFPYAQVADHTSTETYSWSSGIFSFTNDSDDGDGMIETVSQSGYSWTWTASVYSDVIPDGPITIVCVAFDEAGNISTKKITTTVENNPLRMAQVYLGTDLDGDGVFADSEFSTYDIKNVQGSAQQGFSLDTYQYSTYANSTVSASTRARFIAKDKLAVAVQFTGGNYDYSSDEPLYYIYNSPSYSASNPLSSTNYTLAQIQSHDSSAVVAEMTEGNASYLPGSSSYYSTPALYLTNTDLNTTSTEANDGSKKIIGLSFWDSTEETSPGTDSMWAYLNVTFDIDVVDGTVPSATITPFHWAGLTDNSIYGSSTATDISDLQGHIELEGSLDTTNTFTSSHSAGGEYDADPKVSGLISITGSAYDETRLGEIDVGVTGISLNSGTAGALTKMATYANSGNSSDVKNWTLANSTATVGSDGWAFKILTSTLSQSGHTVTWQLDLDTSKVTVSSSQVYALDDVIVLVQAKDAHPNSSDTASTTNTVSGSLTPYYRMDVVPYVSGLTTKLSTLKSNNPSVYNRSALGHYPVNSSESITVSGFNLGSSPVGVFPTSSATVTSTASSGVCSIPDTAVSGSVYFTVSSVKSLNNENTNNAIGSYSGTYSDSTYAYCYNRRPNGDNNNLLTDDIVLDIWNFDSDAAIPISGRIQNPVMDINPKSGMVGFAFVNGPLYYSMGGTVGGTEYSYNYWEGSYDFFTSIGFAYDSLGYSYGCAAGGDINSSSADDFSFMTSRWGRAARVQSGSYYQYNSRRIEQIGMSIDSTYTFNKTRIQSPSFATAVHSTSTNVYLAYYDDMNSEIRFRWGTLSANNTSTDSLSNGTSPNNTSSNAGNAADTSFFYDQYGNGSSTNTQTPQSYNIAHTSLIAGTTSGYSTGYNAGEYVSLGVVSSEGSKVDDEVVVVWYDATSQQLLYSYNMAPTSIAVNTYSGSGWSTPVAVFGSSTGVGQYCKIAVDKNGGIHIAAYDQANADLVYAYASSYAVTASSGFSTCTVDSYSIAGSEITLDVALDSSGNAIPYIGYYANACIRPKVAYKKTTTSNAPAGATDDVFTGSWEISVVPTTSSVPEDHINVGVWKSSGVLAKSNAFTNTTTAGSNAATHTGSAYSAVNYGLIYGNGTSNPILGYQIKSGTSGYIETAQMR
jgi:hypothetical protein